MQYRNFDLDIFDYVPTGTSERFKVKATTPAGEMTITGSEKVSLPVDVRKKVRRLDKRSLTLAEMIEMGELLAAALFPPKVRGFLERSRARLKDGEGLRIRLKFDTYALADLPWEYVYIPHPDAPTDQKGLEGFLVLDRSISLVRREILGTPLPSLDPLGADPLRMVVLLANVDSPDYPHLKLDIEQQNITQVLAKVPEFRPKFYPDATMDSLEEAADEDPAVLHFSGHGEFRGNLGIDYGSLDSEGALILRDASGKPDPFPATKLARTLAGHGIRLIMLGACEAGRRNDISAWTGIVPALTRAGIPAVVGMQFTVKDASAITFSKAFYRSLAAGEAIDEAVSDGRRAIFNRGLSDERDWGVPVLYLRAEQESGILFPKLPSRPAPQITTSHDSAVTLPLPSQGETRARKERVLAELLQPMMIQLGRTKAAFDRWTGKNLYLEAKIIREGNLAVRDLLTAKADLIPADLISDANALVEHYDRWLEEFDRVRGGSQPRDDEGFVFAGPLGYPFPVAAEQKFKDRFGQLKNELATPPPLRPPMSNNINLTDLRTKMDGAFKESGLKLLVADLDQDLQQQGSPYRLDWDNIAGESKVMKILELIQDCKRKGILDFLVTAVSRAHPGLI